MKHTTAYKIRKHNKQKKKMENMNYVSKFVILDFTYCDEIESAPKPQLFFSISSRFYIHIFKTLCINFQVIEKRFGELITHIDDDKTDEDIFHKISKKKVNSISKRKSMAAIQQLRRRRKTSQVCANYQHIS